MGKWNTATFNDVLVIINGKNQRNVENPKGTYPIYGSGGIMGYADDYICEKNSIIIGRKGTINSPIFVAEPFWNVDTAFGLRPNENRLFPKYLFYFCKKFNFEGLNTTVTIPSLTKANLLRIQIPLPPMPIQQKIADVLDHVSVLIEKRKEQIKKLDLIVKSRFVGMFGDLVHNKKSFPLQTGDKIFSFSSGKFNPTNLLDKNYQYPCYGGNGITGYSKYYLIEDETIVIGRVGANCGSVHISAPKSWVTDNAIYLKEYNKESFNLLFLYQLFSFMEINRFADGAGQPKISQKPLYDYLYIIPPLTLQNRFAAFVRQADKTKFVIQQGLEKLELCYTMEGRIGDIDGGWF